MVVVTYVDHHGEQAVEEQLRWLVVELGSSVVVSVVELGSLVVLVALVVMLAVVRYCVPAVPVREPCE